MTRPEEQIQRAIVRALRIALPHGWIVHHSRNGGMSKGENGRAKAMGAVAGFPDLMVMGCLIDTDPSAALPFVGFLEVKTKTGRKSPDQVQCIDRLTDCGFPVAVVRSVEDALETAQAWGLPIKTMRVSA